MVEEDENTVSGHKLLDSNEDFDNGSNQPVVDAPALPSELVAAPANCTGELVRLPHVDGTTFNTYECQTCHQIVTVSLEDLDEYGLPSEHSPLIV